MAAAGTSVAMNVIAAAPGWRDLAVWAMPPAAYALSSDTLIGVVRASAIARHPDSGALAEEVTVLTVAAGVTLWLLRLTMAPRSTLGGFRAWVLTQCPVAPARPAFTPPVTAALSPQAPAPQTAPVPRETKTARFLSLVTERHGSLAAVPLAATAQIAAALAPQVNLNPGAARTALRQAVLAAQNGGPR